MLLVLVILVMDQSIPVAPSLPPWGRGCPAVAREGGVRPSWNWLLHYFIREFWTLPEYSLETPESILTLLLYQVCFTNISFPAVRILCCQSKVDELRTHYYTETQKQYSFQEVFTVEHCDWWWLYLQVRVINFWGMLCSWVMLSLRFICGVLVVLESCFLWTASIYILGGCQYVFSLQRLRHNFDYYYFCKQPGRVSNRPTFGLNTTLDI